MTQALRTPEQARAWLSRQGLSQAQWSRDNHFNPDLVHMILAGRKPKCGFGASHNIAVALGMKDGVRTDKPGRATRHAHLNGVAA